MWIDYPNQITESPEALLRSDIKKNFATLITHANAGYPARRRRV